MPSDHELLLSISSTLAEAGRRSGGWLACRPGCFHCCLGPFPISERDAARLRSGLAAAEPARAARIRERARGWMDRAGPLDENGLPEGMDGEACPVLDPESGQCELYESRPLTCRTFGPAVRSGGVIGACELCYVGATEAEIEACAVEFEIVEEPESTTVARAIVEISPDASTLEEG